MLVLVRAVALDLGAQLGVARERGDAPVLPASLGLALGRDAAEQAIGLVVAANLVVDRACRQHSAPPRTPAHGWGLSYRLGLAGSSLAPIVK